MTPQSEINVRPAAAVQSNALVERAKAGDRVAFGQLVEKHYDFIFRTACKWTGKKSDAEDIAQEVCIKLATAIQSFDGRSAFNANRRRGWRAEQRSQGRTRGRRASPSSRRGRPLAMTSEK